jgi:lysophospholipase L1-like esterase
MKKVVVFLICLTCLIVISLKSFSYIKQFYFSDKYTYFNTPNIEKGSILTIGIIGDSWVAGKALDSLLVLDMDEKGISSHVISSGHPGAKTKKIYQNLFEKEDNINSSKFVIKERPDYCVIIAGVNDAASQVGAKNYAYHMIQIIKTLLHYNIKVVMVSLPEFGIIEYTNSSPFQKRLILNICAYFNNNNEIDNIASYRNVLNSELISNNLIDRILTVNFNNICNNYNQHLDLYRNATHLSKKGNQKLAKEISNIIANDIATKSK